MVVCCLLFVVLRGERDGVCVLFVGKRRIFSAFRSLCSFGSRYYSIILYIYDRGSSYCTIPTILLDDDKPTVPHPSHHERHHLYVSIGFARDWHARMAVIFHPTGVSYGTVPIVRTDK